MEKEWKQMEKGRENERQKLRRKVISSGRKSIQILYKVKVALPHYKNTKLVSKKP